ncbi:MAG: POTRA domain-containing protein, partial [Armatimonadota bacterium]
MKFGVITLVATLLLGFVGAQQRVGRIEVEGCEVTQPELVLEAARIGEGMEFDEEKIRQSLLDLGLFEQVSVQHEPRPDGTVAVTVSVTEKKFPKPTNAAAAKALNLQALAARCWEEEVANLHVEGFLKGKLTFRFWLLSSIQLDWKPTSKAPWVQKFVQWQSTCDEKLKGNLRKELESH